MLLKLYNFLQFKIGQNETKLANKLDKRNNDLSSFSLFNFQIILINQALVMQAILADITKYLIVLFYPHSDSFIVLFHQKERLSCNFSYQHYKTIQKQVRVFSLAGTTTIIVVTVITSLITNLIFGPGHSSFAATFGWVQSGWSAGVDTINKADHNTNQTGWTKYYSKDSGITASSALTLLASTTYMIETSNTDFNTGTNTNTYATSGAVVLLKPNGATCTVDSNCSGDWCNAGVCANSWIPGVCGVTDLTVYKADVPGIMQWKSVYNDPCVAPQCSGGILVADNSVNFSLYPARNACKAIGGRLPDNAELLCIYNNRATYGISFPGDFYFSARENDYTSVWGIGVPSGVLGSANKTPSYYARCVKGQ